MDIALLVLTGTLTTLLAGVFFGYTVSVNGALRRLEDKEYVRAMQTINIVIQNPLFFISFMGPVVLLPATTYIAYTSNYLQFPFLLAATLIYIFGVFGVTVVGNVPLNNQLAKADVSDATKARLLFEKTWVRLHNIRTLFAVTTTIIYITACCL